MIYLHMDLSYKREVQKKFIRYTQATRTDDPKIKKLMDWEKGRGDTRLVGQPLGHNFHT